MDIDAPCRELGRRRLTVRVAPERAEEVDLGAELGQHRRRHDAPAAGVDERVDRVGDGAARGIGAHPNELDPLDVADDRHPGHAGPTLVTRSGYPPAACRAVPRRAAGSAHAFGCADPGGDPPCPAGPRGTSSFAHALLAVRNFGLVWMFDGKIGPLPEKLGFGRS